MQNTTETPRFPSYIQTYSHGQNNLQLGEPALRGRNPQAGGKSGQGNIGEVEIMEAIKTVELKGVKIASNMSEETIAFTGVLWINGAKAADLKNDGQGGDNRAWFKDRELERAFNAYCEALPPEPVTDAWAIERGFTDPSPMNADLWISLEVGKIDEARYWKRKCAKTMCIILKSHKDGQFTQYKAWPYSSSAAAEVRTIHGDELVEIINERFI